MKCEEAQELVTALVDDELSSAERASIEEHLKDCSRCRFIYHHERDLMGAVRVAGAGVSAPASLRQKILSDRRLFPEADSEEASARRPRFFLRPIFAFALLILLALPALYLLRPAHKAVSLDALESYDKILGGKIPLVETASPEEIRASLTHAVGGRFAPMRYDLSTMNLRPVGGAVQEFNGRKLLVTVYADEGKASSVICYTFLGTEEDVPADGRIFFDAQRKMSFYAFSRGDINGVLHREGELICILLSKMAMPDLLELARSKAEPGPL
jgi:hypothetical protein